MGDSVALLDKLEPCMPLIINNIESQSIICANCKVAVVPLQSARPWLATLPLAYLLYKSSPRTCPICHTSLDPHHRTNIVLRPHSLFRVSRTRVSLTHVSLTRVLATRISRTRISRQRSNTLRNTISNGQPLNGQRNHGSGTWSNDVRQIRRRLLSHSDQ